jgi:glutamate racemase
MTKGGGTPRANIQDVGAPDRHGPVALFDSGVGGLTVLHECLVQIPHEDFLYLGDTARFPYGNRSLGELREFAHELDEILVDAGAKMLVVA